MVTYLGLQTIETIIFNASIKWPCRIHVFWNNTVGWNKTHERKPKESHTFPHFDWLHSVSFISREVYVSHSLRWSDTYSPSNCLISNLILISWLLTVVACGGHMTSQQSSIHFKESQMNQTQTVMQTLSLAVDPSLPVSSLVHCITVYISPSTCRCAQSMQLL